MTRSKRLHEARVFALRAHGDQRYGTRPYIFHLDQVADLLAPYGEQAQVVGYLHDVVEDTAIDLAGIESAFGPLVAECVGLLSDEPGADRQTRKARTYAKMAAVQGPAQLALLVKAADRLANVRSCLADGECEKWAVYRGEQRAFRDAAWRAGQCDALWDELDRLLAEDAAPAPRDG